MKSNITLSYNTHLITAIFTCEPGLVSCPFDVFQLLLDNFIPSSWDRPKLFITTYSSLDDHSVLFHQPRHTAFDQISFILTFNMSKPP